MRLEIIEQIPASLKALEVGALLRLMGVAVHATETPGNPQSLTNR